MNGVVTIGGLVAVVMLTPRLATAQSLSSDNAYVLKATARQATTTAPLTLTFSEPFMLGKKRMVRQTSITIPPTDVVDSRTTQVRAHKGSAFASQPMTEFLFVLDVRSRNIPATNRDPLVLTLASGTVVTIPASGIHDGATMWLRANWSTETLPQAPAPKVTGDPDILDTEGVDFGPWVRRLSAQIRRHWFIPERRASGARTREIKCPQGRQDYRRRGDRALDRGGV